MAVRVSRPEKYISPLFYVLAVGGPFLFGHFLPKVDIAGGSFNIVNVPWGCAFGIGWAAAEALQLGFLAGIIGFIVWPIVLLIALTVAAQRVRQAGWKTQASYATLMCASFFLNVKPDAVHSPPFSYLPIFWKYFEAAW